ncbi:hypothetical protein [Flavobacterium acetivorans]|uniref:hypothetical protein n=1 Tax=Flavobacterium acetivorans TaxID=2893883 RepID=UPI001E38676B|nr:hypothetical protein [Flavobacterium sp. F-29]UFH34563.1 hypothetical protein LNP19_10715 [Flavobacterium sp. F-29]
MTVPNSTWCTTAGGTFLSVLPNLSSEDVLKTVLLAIIGTVVSFIISLVLKNGMKKRKK